jgi:hypothetical protein
MVLPLLLPVFCLGVTGAVGGTCYGAFKAKDAVNDLAGSIKNWKAQSMPYVRLVGLSLSFTHTITGLCTVINTFSGLSAQKEVISVYRKISKDVESIAQSLDNLRHGLDTLVSFKNQHEFGAHVYDLLKMRITETKQEPEAYFFVFNRGTEWRPRFSALNKAQPLGPVCGIFNNLHAMAAFLIEFRKTVSPTAVFHVLFPVTELVFIADAIAVPTEIGPLRLEGELHNQTGFPYVWVNMPGAAKDLLSNIGNVADIKLSTPTKSSSGWGRWCASTSAAWAVALPSAVVATPGGLVLGLGCGLLVECLCPPLVLATVVGALVGGAGAGAGVGTMTGMFIGGKVEEAWDK